MMSAQTPSLAGRIKRHVRNRLLSGVLVLVPLAITVFVIRVLFKTMGSILAPVVKLLLGPLDDRVVLVIALVVFAVLVYLVGLITAHIVGRRLLALGEGIILRIPVVRTIYAGAKQVIDSFSLSNRGSFTEVVVVDYPRPGLKALAFVTGTMQGRDGRTLYKLFIPTTPNPTSGVLAIAEEDQVVRMALSVEEAVKMVVSAGMLSPPRLDC